MSDVKYKIKNFDRELLRMDVDLFDDGWARIQLTHPLPQTVEDLEAIIRRFVPPVEVVQARKDTNSDMHFVHEILGKTRTIPRASLAGDPVVEPESSDALAKAEKEFLKKQVESILRKHKLIK